MAHHSRTTFHAGPRSSGRNGRGEDEDYSELPPMLRYGRTSRCPRRYEGSCESCGVLYSLKICYCSECGRERPELDENRKCEYGIGIEHLPITRKPSWGANP